MLCNPLECLEMESEPTLFNSETKQVLCIIMVTFYAQLAVLKTVLSHRDLTKNVHCFTSGQLLSRLSTLTFRMSHIRHRRITKQLFFFHWYRRKIPQKARICFRVLPWQVYEICRKYPTISILLYHTNAHRILEFFTVSILLCNNATFIAKMAF